MSLVICSRIAFVKRSSTRHVFCAPIRFNMLNRRITSSWWTMEGFFEQVTRVWSSPRGSSVLLEFYSEGKPDEVLASAELLLSPTNQSSQTSVATTHKSSVENEEHLVETENALQTDVEERCTGESGECHSRSTIRAKDHLGTVKWSIWKRYFIAVGICLSFSIVLAVFLMQGTSKRRMGRHSLVAFLASRNVFDWWLSYWTSHQLSIVNMTNITGRASFRILNPSV